MRTFEKTLLVAFGLLLSSCSFMGLDDFPLPSCTSDRDCQLAFNGQLGLYEQCAAFQCVGVEGEERRECVRIQGEICDGLDNDCDYVIDEASGGSGGISVVIDPPAESVTATGPAAAHDFEVSVDSEFGVVMAFTDISTAEAKARVVLVQDGDASGAPAEMTYHANSSLTNPRDKLLCGWTDSSCMDGCRVESMDSRGVVNNVANCEFGELAVGAFPGGQLVASITTAGCDSGQLRLGHGPADNLQRVVVRGPARRSSVYLGVDPTPGGCSNNGSAACESAIEAYDETQVYPTGYGDTCDVDGDCMGTLICRLTTHTCVETMADATARADMAATTLMNVKTRCGVTRPSVAVIDPGTEEPQGLVTYLADGTSRDICGGSVVDVRAIGAYVMEGNFAGAFTWVEGTNEGASEVIGQTRGGARPAVVRWSDRGYFVAHSDAEGDLALHFVPRLPTPPNNRGTVCCQKVLCPAGTCAGEMQTCGTDPEGGPDMVCNYTGGECLGESFCEDMDDRNGVETDPLPAITDLAPIAAAFGGPVDHVSLAIGSPRGENQLDIGLTWVEGCGTDDSSIVFRRVVLDVSGDPQIAEMDPPVKLNLAGRRQETPTIAYVSSGFVVPRGDMGDPIGYSRDGETATDTQDGGWWVAWRDRSDMATSARVLARRISELDGQLLDADCAADRSCGDDIVQLETTLPGKPAPDPAMPRLYVENRILRYAYADRTNNEVVGGVLGCR